MAWAIGGLFTAILSRKIEPGVLPDYCQIPGFPTLLLMVRIASGLAIASWIGALLGVAGQFKLGLLLSLLLTAIFAGFLLPFRIPLTYRPTLLRDRFYLRQHWVSATRGEKVFAAAIIFFLCAIAVNALIGSLVPDMNHDPMWHHLTIAQQWGFDERYLVYPAAMHSAFPLAAESVFAILLKIGSGPVLCTLVISSSALVMFAIIISGVWACQAVTPQIDAYKMWGVCAVMAVVIPLMTMYGLIAPVQPKNDMLMLCWFAAGAIPLIVTLLGQGKLPTTGWWLTSGFLLGTAICAKPPSLSMTFFFGVFVAPLTLMYGRHGHHRFWGLHYLLFWVIAMAVAAAPWVLRGYLSHGVPLYPVGTSLFPMSTEYAGIDKAQTGIQKIPGLNPIEWLRKLQEFPERMLLGAANGEKMFFIYLVIAVLGAGTLKGRWRWYSVTLLFQLAFLIGLTAAVEIYRFFSPAYILAAPVLAVLVSKASVILSPTIRYIASAAVWLGVAASIIAMQARTASRATYDWEFRPVLSKQDVEAYAQHAEMGGSYFQLTEARQYIEPYQRVLLFDLTYPFYLHRDTLWNDETVIAGGWLERWKQFSADQAKAFLAKERIDVVLYVPRSKAEPKDTAVLDSLEASGHLIRRLISGDLEARGCGLWELKRP